MKKAEHASVHENEVETAQRSSFARPIPVEHLASTARIPKIDLENILRSESGTRPVVTRDEIAQHMEEKLVPAVEIKLEPSPEDAHARPTIDVFPRVPLSSAPPLSSSPPFSSSPQPSSGPISAVHSTPVPVVLTPPQGITPFPGFAPPFGTQRSPSFSPESMPHASIQTRVPRWLVPVAIGGVLFLMTITVALGFFLGRLTGHH